MHSPLASTEQVDPTLAVRAWHELQAWKQSQLTDRPQDYAKAMDAMTRLFAHADIPTMVPLLPLLLSLKGKPYSLKDHFPFEPLFKRRDVPRQTLLMTGRQLSKSTNVAAQGVIRTAAIPFFNTLYVCPLFEQIRRFSSNYVRPFIQSSPVRNALVGKSVGAGNVLQRTFVNESIMHFTFAFLDAERVRGIAADSLVVDECVRWDTNVQLSTGNQKIISDIRVGEEVAAFTPEGQVVTDRVIGVVNKGHRPMWRITLVDGRFLDCTRNEKLWTSQGWMYLAEILKAASLPGLFIHGGNLLISVPIGTVQSIGEDEVWDLETENHHTFFANGIAVHNCQDINFDFLGIIYECLSASKYGLIQLTGTPKTKDNTLYLKWLDSSQAQWIISCSVCGYYNTCCIELDLDHMIQRDGLCCRKCGRLVNSRDGYFEHQVIDDNRVAWFAGYHIPQVILPLHYDNPAKWRTILEKKAGDPVKYFNECLGEAKDVASMLITRTDLQKASQLPWENNFQSAMENLGRYPVRSMGVDWGGGAGGTVRRVRGNLVVEGGSPSFTVVTITGFEPGNPWPHVIYTERLSSGMGQYAEVKRVLELYRAFDCYRLGHDYGGAGNLREAMLLQAGFPSNIIFPCQYMAAANKGIVTWNPAGPLNPRSYYTVDKARSLGLICTIIKASGDMGGGGQMFPQWDSVKDLAEDFLALVEDRRDRPGGSDIYLITKHPRKTDDFCHSLNYACLAHWYTTQHFPDLAERFSIGLSEEEMKYMYGEGETSWSE